MLFVAEHLVVASLLDVWSFALERQDCMEARSRSQQSASLCGCAILPHYTPEGSGFMMDGLMEGPP